MIVHPDLRVTWTQQITYTAAGLERYEICPDAAYVLSARLVPHPGVSEFSVTLFTSTSPTNAGDDEGKIPLHVDLNGRPDDYRVGDAAGEGGIFFDNGIYASTYAAVDGADAILQVIFVPRRNYCPAFKRPERSLRECWDEANNEGLKEGDPGYLPFKENFWDFERENPEEDGGTSGGGSTPGGSEVGVPLS